MTETTEHPTLDGPRALALLREVVAERPDYVYETPQKTGGTCLYVHRGQPSCVVGHVLARAGYAAEQIAQLDEWGRINFAANQVDDIHIAPEAQWILGAAQIKQDHGTTWAVALAAAEREAAALGVSA